MARRWLAALLLVDVDEREALVSTVEAQIVRAADEDEARGAARRQRRTKPAEGMNADRELHLVSAPVRRDGYVEQKITTYAVTGRPAKPLRVPRSKRA